MSSEQYIDGLKQIHFVAGMVRMDTFVLEPKDDGEPDQTPAARLLMTPQGFVGMLGAMQQMADKLVEAGVLQKTQQ